MTDSPFYQLIEDFPSIDRFKTDVFQEQIHYSGGWKRRLRNTQGKRISTISAAKKELDDLYHIEAGILGYLFLSCRAPKGFQDMVSLAQRMPQALSRTPMIREKLALALDRIGRDQEAAQILLESIKKRGPCSGRAEFLVGFINTSRQPRHKLGKTTSCSGLDKESSQAYMQGFERDWWDIYPGVNALTLVQMCHPPDSRFSRILPVVPYANERRLVSGQKDHWTLRLGENLPSFAVDYASASARAKRESAPWNAELEPELRHRTNHLAR